MQSCDFLLTYEIKNREAESVCLLKYELERRGYSVIIQEQYRPFFEPPESIDAKVVVVPAYYRDRVRFYTSSHTPHVSKVVNLQWEQMIARSRTGSGSLTSIKSWGRGAMHLCWGEDNRRRLVGEYEVPEDHTALVGHMGMDFLRFPLRNYYLSRDEVCARYKLPKQKDICLFISSFAIANSHEKFVEGACSSEEDRRNMEAFRQASKESQATLIEWFEALLNEDPDKVLVYRPHPEERNNELIRRMQAKHENFCVISDLSVKQWILACDKIFTWTSTSVAEVFFAEKTCLVLNPVPIPKQMTMQLYEHAKVIATCDEFLAAACAPITEFPIPEEDIRTVYYSDHSRFSYELACDALERVLHDDGFSLEEPLDNPFAGLINLERIKCSIKRAVANSSICKNIHDNDKLKGTALRKNIDDVLYVREKLAKNHVSEEEFQTMLDRIANALASGGRQ